MSLNIMLRGLVVAAALAIPAGAALADEAALPTLTVSGDGTATGTPDIAVVTLGVVAEAASARDALAGNARDMNAVVTALGETGIAGKDIATSGFSVEPVYSDPEKSPDGKSVVTGYRVSNQVTVKIRDLTASGPLLDKVVGAGANRITGISFDIDKADALQDQAVKAAVAEARRKAAMIAEAAGVKLGAIQSISTNNGGPMPVVYKAQMEMRAPAPTPMMPGEQQITANATIVYAISAP